MFRKLFPAVLVFVLAAELLFKDEMNEFISVKMKQQAGTEVVLSGETQGDSLSTTPKGKRFSVFNFKSGK